MLEFFISTGGGHHVIAKLPAGNPQEAVKLLSDTKDTDGFVHLRYVGSQNPVSIRFDNICQVNIYTPKRADTRVASTFRRHESASNHR